MPEPFLDGRFAVHDGVVAACHRSWPVCARFDAVSDEPARLRSWPIDQARRRLPVVTSVLLDRPVAWISSPAVRALVRWVPRT